MKRLFAFGPSVLLLVACGSSTPPASSAAASATSAPSAAPISRLDCASSATDHDHVALHADLNAMTGTVSIDGFGQGARRILAKVVPYSATYLFMFAGYGPGDQKPGAENLAVGKSIVGRLVSVGEDTIPYFDGDVPLKDAAGKRLESPGKCAAPSN